MLPVAMRNFFLVLVQKDKLKTHIFMEHLFIDEISLNGLFDPETQRYQLGFTLGGIHY